MTVILIIAAIGITISLLVAHTAYALADRFTSHIHRSKEMRHRYRKDLAYTKLL